MRSRLFNGESVHAPNLAAEIIFCYERARLAREKAEAAINDDFRAEFLAAEGRWLALALSYERQHQLSRTIDEFERRRKEGAITRLLREHRRTFDPDDIASSQSRITPCSINSASQIAKMGPR